MTFEEMIEHFTTIRNWADELATVMQAELDDDPVANEQDVLAKARQAIAAIDEWFNWLNADEVEQLRHGVGSKPNGLTPST